MEMRRKNVFLEIYGELYSFFGPQFWWPAKSRFEVIVGAILTQNTSWSNVETAITALRKAKLLKPEKILKADIGKLAKTIRSSGYFNQKAKRLKNFALFLFENFDGSLDVMSSQNTVDLRMRLLEINGIGEETADSILLYACNKPVFVVDTYTKRIFSCHGIIAADETYSQIQKKIMVNLKSDTKLFNEYHALIVALGKNICLKNNPLCGNCPLFALKKKNIKRLRCS